MKEEFLLSLQNSSVSAESAESVFRRLRDMYSEPERRYHTLRHIRDIQSGIIEYRNLFSHYDAYIFACWYHDAVYDSKSKTNEEDSAELAVRELSGLGIPEKTVLLCRDAVLSTKRHIPVPETEEMKLFLDLDLKILGANDERYEEYKKEVRSEYSWVPEETYRKERANVMKYFLKRDRIYFTEMMHQKFDAQARKNLKQEIEELEK
ncbi:MAG TPA: hypothetical protein PK683_01680 [Leptospiraceae bacterium]|nr:hypothetical protein [Leptospiraceae bacterium]HNF25278.1 hypothetical protein [Leptospiraceae bacterium]HNH07183.1 hypothetical protein [Leptospiraceae bacterium]HNI98645.1 hypothetical protein [Leptospiraceae bacterium]HNM05099.1 hypothetical protein [Leptospiraceae bacterium]